MTIFDIYKNKKDNSLIQIDSFATHMNSNKDMIIVYSNIEKHSEYEIGSCPSFNGYGTKQEIESEYELFIKSKDLKKYDDWNDIFDLLEEEK